MWTSFYIEAQTHSDSFWDPMYGIRCGERSCILKLEVHLSKEASHYLPSIDVKSDFRIHEGMPSNRSFWYVIDWLNLHSVKVSLSKMQAVYRPFVDFDSWWSNGEQLTLSRDVVKRRVSLFRNILGSLTILPTFAVIASYFIHMKMWVVLFLLRFVMFHHVYVFTERFKCCVAYPSWRSNGEQVTVSRRETREGRREGRLRNLWKSVQ